MPKSPYCSQDSESVKIVAHCLKKCQQFFHIVLGVTDLLQWRGAAGQVTTCGVSGGGNDGSRLVAEQERQKEADQRKVGQPKIVLQRTSC